MKGLVKENSPRDKENKKKQKDNKQKQTEPSELSRLATARNEPSRDEATRVELSRAIKAIGHPMTHWQWSVKYTQKDGPVPPGSGNSSQYEREHNEKFMLDVMVSSPPKKRRRMQKIRKILNHLNEMHAKDNARGRERDRESWYEMSMIWIPLTEYNNNEIKRVKNYNCHNSKSHFHCSRAFSRRIWLDMKIIVMQICTPLPPPLFRSVSPSRQTRIICLWRMFFFFLPHYVYAALPSFFFSLMT